VNDFLDSSDADRHARSLKHAQFVTFDNPFPLQHGASLPSVTVAYETYGQLNDPRDNAILICHALSGDSHVARHDADDDAGWWDLVVGPGCPIDTNRYFVICPNVLGGCRGTTGPNSIHPDTGKPYGADFPVVTISDLVKLQEQLIDHLGITKLRAVVGGSLGGHMAITWATELPERLAGVVAIATSARLTSQALAFDVVARNAIMRDPHFHAGQYYDADQGPDVGLAIARMLGHITYLSREAMTAKFDATRSKPQDIRTQFETRFSVGSYLAYQGDRFVERFDANSYLVLSTAMDLFDKGQDLNSLATQLGNSKCRWLIISFSSDWLFPPFQSQEMVNALISVNRPVSYCNIESDCGHDGFLLPNDFDRWGELIRWYLMNIHDAPQLPSTACRESNDDMCCELGEQSTTSIFKPQHRLDYDSIVELIDPGASVLDLGCGNGALLEQLRARGHSRLMGFELDELAIVTTVRRGFDVVQGDLNQGLFEFADNQFDYVVLSQTLQTVLDVDRLLEEILRVGRRAIVSFPNLGYRAWRSQLADEGRAPDVDASQGYAWYNTPNVRFLTIADFSGYCEEKSITIHRQVSLNTQLGHQVLRDPNLEADVAIMVLSR
jgi:homoserine O-acetyltransferase